MKILKNKIKNLIPFAAIALSNSCTSPEPPPINKLKEYALKNKELYEKTNKLLKEKICLFSKDKKVRACMPDEKDRILLTAMYEDNKTKRTFIDYGADGLSINDEYIDSFGPAKILKELSPNEQLSIAKNYTWHLEEIYKENEN